MTDQPADTVSFPWDTFAANLDTLIANAGSAEAFAFQVGISFWTLRSWRDERAVPTTASLLAIADEYDTDLDTLLRGKVPARRKTTK